jgi:hypothetical protein
VKRGPDYKINLFARSEEIKISLVLDSFIFLDSNYSKVYSCSSIFTNVNEISITFKIVISRASSFTNILVSPFEREILPGDYIQFYFCIYPGIFQKILEHVLVQIYDFNEKTMNFEIDTFALFRNSASKNIIHQNFLNLFLSNLCQM